ncbi:MAG: murein hydrolase activator EnvC family protein [Pseudomonadota bacterium]
MHLPGRLLLTSVLLLACVADGHAAEQETPPREQLEAVNQAIGQIEQWLDEASDTLSEEEQRLRRIQQVMTAREQDIADNRQQIRSLRQELSALRQQADRLRRDIESDQELVARAVRASWMSRRDSPLKLLLNQEDPGRGRRLLRYFGDFNQARAEQIRAWQSDLDELQNTRARIRSRQTMLDAENDQLEQQLVALEENREQRRAAVEALQADMQQRTATLETLQDDREQLEALIEEINRIVVDIPAPEDAVPFDQARGNMPWPLEGRPVNRFGERYSDGNLRRRGIIIEADPGTPVRAIHQGRVVFADWLRGSGLLVVVDHRNGYISLYAHNGALDKRSGDWVNRGEPVATAGNNAGMNTPGVYFEIRQGGDPLDPADWLLAR